MARRGDPARQASRCNSTKRGTVKRHSIGLIVALLLTGCARQSPEPPRQALTTHPGSKLLMPVTPPAGLYSDYIHDSASIYGVDETLVKAIIQVESGYNPSVVSKSNAIGLMQLKASTAGRDAYRLKGRHGQPSTHELKDAATNIDLGTAYLSLLQKQLAGISNPETRRYALTVAYVNGAGALLRTFSANRDAAVAQINAMTPQQFYQHVQRKHPAPQAPRYLWKVNTAYLAMR